MTREQAREKVLDYAYGELSPGETAAFEAILREDAELRAEVEAVALVQRAASGLERPELPPLLRGRLMMAARRESYRRAMARRWEAIQKLFLSPIFLGATGIIAAVGVGIHLILTQGTEDPWTRMDREQRTAVLAPAEPSPASPPAQQQAGAEEAEAPAAEAKALEDGAGAPANVGERAVGLASAGDSREQAPSRQVAKADDRPGGAAGKVAAGPMSAKGRAGEGRATSAGAAQPEGRPVVTGGTGAGGGGVGYTRRGTALADDSDREARSEGAKDALAKAEQSRFASPPPASAPTAVMSSAPSAAMPSEAMPPKAMPLDSASSGVASSPGALRAPSAAAPSDEAPAAESVSRDRAKKAARVDAEDPEEHLAEARELRAAGYLRDALDAYRRALTAGLAGERLADALAEAAEVARALGRTAESDAFLVRLERLPGGPARAAKIRAK